jgi:hypothetical protein
MEEKIKELIFLAYKNRFSIYYKPNECLVRTYFKDGNQHKEIGKTVEEAIEKMVAFLKLNK